MKVIFHIGWSKTGTSAFQKWLLNNENNLLEKGIFYPETGRWTEGSHHELALSLQPVMGYSSEYSAKELWGRLIQEIQEKSKSENIDNILVTSELFPPLYEYGDVLQLFGKEGINLGIIAVVREQVSLIRSMQHQLVTDPRVHLTGTVNQFFEYFKENYLYFEQLKKYQESYHWDTFKVLPYDYTNVVQNLAKNIGWDEDIEGVSYENVSLSYEVVEFIRRLNQVDMSLETRKEVNEKVAEAINAGFINNGLLRELTEEEINTIKNYYSESNIKLFKEYGIDPSSFQ